MNTLENGPSRTLSQWYNNKSSKKLYKHELLISHSIFHAIILPLLSGTIESSYLALIEDNKYYSGNNLF